MKKIKPTDYRPLPEALAALFGPPPKTQRLSVNIKPDKKPPV